MDRSHELGVFRLDPCILPGGRPRPSLGAVSSPDGPQPKSPTYGANTGKTGHASTCDRPREIRAYTLSTPLKLQ
jgi:hypothetical protein